MKNLIKKIAVVCAQILPVRWWGFLERASAYFQGKGSGSDFLEGEVVAAARVMRGDALVVFDVGANHGDWTEAILQFMKVRIARIYQFEPSSHNVDLLKKKFL